jgi:hypothetical protein
MIETELFTGLLSRKKAASYSKRAKYRKNHLNFFENLMNLDRDNAFCDHYDW